MTIKEYFKEGIKAIKDHPPNERLAYFWEYYKWYAIIFLLVIVLLVQGVLGVINRRETALSGVLLNCKLGVADKEFLQDFYAYAGIDEAKESAAFYTDLTITNGQSKNDLNAFQRIMGGIAVRDTDFIVGKSDVFPFFSYNSTEIFMDLRDFLSQETLAQVSDRLYYIDGEFLKLFQLPPGTEITADITKAPDPRKPEAMKDPIPVGIDISDHEAFQSAYFLGKPTVYLGVVSNTTRPDTVMKFIEYLLS